jgi:type III pantothenate kinase
MILCIDIGNTTIHYALINGKEVYVEESLPSSFLDKENHSLEFGEKLKGFIRGNSCRGISFCSVVPRYTKKLKNILSLIIQEDKNNKTDSSFPSIFNLTYQCCSGLAINYPNPAEIGQDRLANAIGAQAFYGIPSIIIDMGTAVTLDILTEKGYEGGIIAPGFELMSRYLNEQTALLPRIDLNDIAISRKIGKTTVEAMQVGCIVGFKGMIRELVNSVLDELKEQFSDAPVIIATGGNADILQQTWSKNIVFDPHIALKGLAEAFLRNRQCHC